MSKSQKRRERRITLSCLDNAERELSKQGTAIEYMAKNACRTPQLNKFYRVGRDIMPSGKHHRRIG